jgi:nitrate reductase gamma subunit
MSQFLFGVFPYIASVLAVVITIYEYRRNSFHFSSISSQFLEGKKLFWGSIPWHYGILTVLAGHLLAFIFPSAYIAFAKIPMRLLILEVTSLVFGMMAFIGLVMLFKRRMLDSRINIITTNFDISLLLLLLIQVGSGVAVAIFYRWGSSWYASAVVPYLRSLWMLDPDITYIASMPFVVKLHVFNSFLLIAIIPFTRLMHFLVAPFHYFWRPYQIVIWNWSRRRIRKADQQ